MLENEDLIKLANYKMPFGRFKGSYLIDLPEPYLLWFRKEGMPAGKLGELMALAIEIKLNGLEHLLKPLRHD